MPSQAADDRIITDHLAGAFSVEKERISGFERLRQSVDARGKQTWVSLTVNVFVDEPFTRRDLKRILLPDVSAAKNSAIIIGAGPAGLFAALTLIEQGIKPIILERGKDVRARRRDLAVLNKEGIINPESNYCFGEGGAGTYSDGKLYTRSTKRGDVNRILNILVQFGADEKILYESHPHIGTNKLPQIITSVRKHIIHAGGQVLFEKKVIDLIVQDGMVTEVKTADEHIYRADAVILATGHSARDVFVLLHEKNILIEAKPFALGVRVEHQQTLIDRIQYHCATRGDGLPPASYSLVEQVSGKGVFSFCMCPGGIIAPASTNPGEVVVNGWSPSKRNNPYANSGIVVQVETKDVLLNRDPAINGTRGQGGVHPLLLMQFQRQVEQKAFAAGGGLFVAPAQRLTDFCQSRFSSTLPSCSYLPGIASADLASVLPGFVHEALRKGFLSFGKRMKGYLTDDAVVVATESRTSSPVRIPRDPSLLHHPQLKNLYPCGEGAGYAGGIISAAMDGEKIARMIAAVFKG